MSADETGRPRCGVIGSPVAHSLSPVLHTAAYADLGLDWTYDTHDVTVETLDAFFSGVDDDPRWVGLSVTMPLKVPVVDHVEDIDWAGGVVGAVNTVVRRDDGGWSGSNTDVFGFTEALTAAGVRHVKHVLVLGAGATAASAICAVAGLGATKVSVLARSSRGASHLGAVAERVGVELVLDTLGRGAPHDVDLLVSTIPAAAQERLVAAAAPHAPVVFDVIYDPVDTPLLDHAARRGDRCIGGFELLLHQAGRQVELMTGCTKAPLEPMRRAGLRALLSRAALPTPRP